MFVCVQFSILGVYTTHNTEKHDAKIDHSYLIRSSGRRLHEERKEAHSAASLSTGRPATEAICLSNAPSGTGAVSHLHAVWWRRGHSTR